MNIIRIETAVLMNTVPRDGPTTKDIQSAGRCIDAHLMIKNKLRTTAFLP